VERRPSKESWRKRKLKRYRNVMRLQIKIELTILKEKLFECEIRERIIEILFGPNEQDPCEA